MSIKYLFTLLIIYIHQSLSKFYTKKDIPSTSVRQSETLRESFILFSNDPKFQLKEAEYSCRYGGYPLVIWAVKEDDNINSSESIIPIYIEEGFNTSDINVSYNIKSNKTDKNYFHMNVQSPTNGKISFILKREEEKEFYIDIVHLPNVYSFNSNKTVLSFSMEYSSFDDDGIVNLYRTPTPITTFQSSSISLLTLFYENTDFLKFDYFFWDQKLPWSDDEITYIQDMVIRLSPEEIEGVGYNGNGFVICGNKDRQDEFKNKNKVNGNKGHKLIKK